MSGKEWQNLYKGNKSRAEHVLQAEKFTDCQFLVEQGTEEAVRIHGHKLILAMASPVFEVMFYGNFEEKKSNEIRIPNIKHKIFHMMMDYIYSEKLELKTIDDAMELYSAAHQYRMQDLMEGCIDYILNIKKIELNERWKVYEFAVLFEENDLITKSADWMAHYAKEILNDPGFVGANLTTLIALFERDCLWIDSELDLFRALNEYALANGYFDTKDSAEDKEVQSNIGKRELLREALKRIRFMCLTPEQFAIVSKSELLTEREVFSILMNKLSPDITNMSMPEGFSKSRTPRKQNW